MPGIDHEMPLELIRNRPETAVELLRCAKRIELPPFAAARVESADSTQPSPIEFRADSVVVLRDETGAALMAVIVEVQQGRDAGKRFSWPVYVTTLRSQHKCDTALLVICPDRSTARWCERTIHLGPSGTITPLAIDPGRIPLITDPDQARASPELAVLSTVAHPDEADDEPVLEAMLAGLATLDQDRARVYLNYVISSLRPVTVKRLEEMVTTIQDFDYLGDKYFSHWKDQGRAEALLIMLDARGLEISDDARERIQRCEDTNQLEAWVRKAAVVTSADELFDE
ncbi:hypothetical protein ACQPZZ_29675 [Microbispora sp. CA-135349]|uniref:hypothetical protein n=1 Tax=Microbispora sp. CA-135349 TaxID=3239953 RepID=UPI003D8D1611